jgi:hypothetical protein
MSAEMDSRTSTFERTLFPRGCQANIACLRAGGLRHSQHIFGDLARVRTPIAVTGAREG